MWEKADVIEKQESRKKSWCQRLREDELGAGVIEVLLILVGIFTPYYGVGIRCMA